MTEPVYKFDSIVEVQLYDGRRVIAKVCAVFDTVSGRKVRIQHGATVNLVNADQILRVIRL